jgi:dTDP-4-dehydrorhamnose reductase
MKIFISGASGLVGGNCLQHFAAQGHLVLGTYLSYPVQNTYYFNTLKLHDEINIDIHSFQPDVIVHCGALTHVDYCETHQEESYQKTVQSTINMIALANELKAKLVYISTDYVFDGNDGPYNEADQVNPLSVYGKHKLQAEEAVLSSHPYNLVLRVTNVYGNEKRNKNFVSRLIEQCLAGDKLLLRLPIDQYATPVNAWDIARAMLLLLEVGESGVFHIASNEYLNRVELASLVLAQFPQAKYEIQEMTTSGMQQAAPRPLKGGLKNDKFINRFPSFKFSKVDEFVSSFAK